MGMSTHASGFREPDEKWRQMKQVYDSCASADVKIPKEVDDFFGGMAPDPSGVSVDIPLRRFSSEMIEGFEIDIVSLPKNIKTVRFWNSW